MNKVIIRTRGQELTPAMRNFGNYCAESFIRDECSEGWEGVPYCNDALGLSGWAKLSSSGTLSVLVVKSAVNPCN